MFTKSSDDERQAQISRMRKEIEQIGDRADSLERILPTVVDAEVRHKIQQVIESCRLHANRLSETIRDNKDQ